MTAPTQDELKQMLAESTGTNPNEITLDSRFDDLGLESSDQANFAAEVQKRYNVRLDQDDLGNMTTVGDFYRHLVASS